jgi:hypothetical protein
MLQLEVLRTVDAPDRDQCQIRGAKYLPTLVFLLVQLAGPTPPVSNSRNGQNYLCQSKNPGTGKAIGLL